jgi:murein DD-endopeptidase MepM/ murein hydrolase activator NlpD
MIKDYHIILVPKDKAQTKSFKLSGFTLKVIILSILLSLPLLFGAILSALHYQNDLVSLKRENYENRKLLENKKELLQKIAGLEHTLSVMDESVSHLSQVMDVDLDSMKFGLGPVSDTEISLREPAQNAAPDIDLVDEWRESDGDLTLNKVTKKLSELKDDSGVLSQKLEEIYSQSKDKIRFVNSAPSTMPVNGWITSEFGMRKHPIFGGQRMHYGLDIASPIGTEVKAPAEGKVVYAGPRAGYGNLVILDHGYGISTLFAHLSAFDVKLGQIVKKGDGLAKVGTTGSSTGPHVHYEVQVDGIPTNPLAYIVK